MMLNRVLCGDDDERRGQRMRHAFNRDVAFGHRFKQRGLSLRRGAVDFIRQHDVGEDRAGLPIEDACVLIINRETETSEGSRSEVNCMRWKVQSSARASACASVVLPTPGTSSTNRCPPAIKVTMARRTASGFPLMTCSIAACSSSILSTAARAVPGASLSAVCNLPIKSFLLLFFSRQFILHAEARCRTCKSLTNSEIPSGMRRAARPRGRLPM